MATVRTEDSRLTVVTADSHVGPPLAALRPYCEDKLRDAFDSYATHALDAVDPYRWDPSNEMLKEWFRGDEQQLHAILEGLLRNTRSAGGIDDVHQRLRDLDADGVAGEGNLHGTPDATGVFWPLPFDGEDPTKASTSAETRELNASGRRIFNRWLADFCSEQPERHAGLCHLPIWDIDAAIAEVRWAAAHGLRGVNFPSPSEDLPPYEDPRWDRFFSVCEELQMPLVTHVGGGQFGPYYTGPASTAIMVIESIAVSGRNLWQLIFSGAFDRHPGLTLVIAEVPGTWFVTTLRDMESVYGERIYFSGAPLRRTLARRPTDYVHSNVYFACSFMSRAEAEATMEADLVDRVLWGSDYPHPEGTWDFTPEGVENATSVTKLSLANTFAGFPPGDVAKMVGGNAVRCFRLDPIALQGVADQIGPTVAEISTLPDLAQVPSTYTGQGFRTGAGPWT